MEYIILGLLHYSDMTIYDINRSLKNGLSLIYSASYGSIQNALKKLLKNNMIRFYETTENGRDKKTYVLCDRGRQAFDTWMREDIKTNKLETNMLMKVYFLGLIHADTDKLAILEDIIEKTQSASNDISSLEETIHSTLNREEKDIFKYPLMTLDYGVMAHESALKWIQSVYDSIEKTMNE